MYYKFLLVFLLMVFGLQCVHSKDNNYVLHHSGFISNTGPKKPLKGFSLKLSPAFFWKTLIIEAELPLNSHVTIGLNALGKLGGGDGKKELTKEENEAYNTSGLGAELALKFYFKGESPEGLYLQVNGGYSNIFYYDGNTKPYTIHNHWRKQDELVFKKPEPYYGGIGVGYQVILLPDHLIANVMVGFQGNMYDNKSFPLSIYIAPSIGYKF